MTPAKRTRLAALTLLLLTFAVLAGCRDRLWLANIDRLETGLRSTHPNLFFHVSQDQFTEALDALRGSVTEKEDHQIVVEMARIAAMVNDGHTGISLLQTGWGAGVFPLNAYLFSDGYYVTDVQEDYEDLLGKKLVSIGGHDIAEVEAAVSKLIFHDEGNEGAVKGALPHNLVIGEALHALGFIEDRKRALFGFADGTSVELHSLLLPLMAIAEDGVSRPDPLTDGLPLYLKGRDVRGRFVQTYFFEYLGDHETLYTAYRRCLSHNDAQIYANELLSLIDLHGPTRIVLDLRHNPGGEYTGDAYPVFAALQQWATQDDGHGLYVLIGRQTQSSAVQLSVNLHRKTNAVFLGEPTGNSVNRYGNLSPFNLVFPPLVVYCSSKSFNYGDEYDGGAFFPDVEIPLSSDQYFAGEDPVLQAVLNDA